MNICYIPCRLASTRLPNKVLKEINGKTLLQIHIYRIKQAKQIDTIYIALMKISIM